MDTSGCDLILILGFPMLAGCMIAAFTNAFVPAVMGFVITLACEIGICMFNL